MLGQTEPQGKLGVLIPGLGAVATTFIAGVMNIRRGLGKPIGSLTQMGLMPVPEQTETVPVGSVVPLARLDDIVFGGWDIFEDNLYEAAQNAKVLEAKDLESVREELEAIKPMKAVFDVRYVKKLDGTHVKEGPTKMSLAEQVRADIQAFKEEHGLERLVMIWCGSTEVFLRETAVHATIDSFEEGLRQNDDGIAPSMIYAYAAIMEDVPFINGAPNLTSDVAALTQLAIDRGVPIAGKDFKTGQTLMKTILAPGLKARMLGIEGWFSTNILGNRDGQVLDDPDSFKTKEESKLGVLDYILEPDVYPDLYKDFYHKVRINYYPPLGDNKEGWDNIDIFGWLEYPMQIKVNFLCRDSILAAPIVLDLVLFMDLAHRSGRRGIQDWLSFYFKAPVCLPGQFPEHDLFVQLNNLHQSLYQIRQRLGQVTKEATD
ncbi:MAG TPA: inositol-3-phosphate synthase [Anaerolineae bacterium]|nr:inositol-3-phosphate synthase [Anaerolineae bacterium]